MSRSIEGYIIFYLKNLEIDKYKCLLFEKQKESSCDVLFYVNQEELPERNDFKKHKEYTQRI